MFCDCDFRLLYITSASNENVMHYTCEIVSQYKGRYVFVRKLVENAKTNWIKKISFYIFCILNICLHAELHSPRSCHNVVQNTLYTCKTRYETNSVLNVAQKVLPSFFRVYFSWASALFETSFWIILNRPDLHYPDLKYKTNLSEGTNHECIVETLTVNMSVGKIHLRHCILCEYEYRGGSDATVAIGNLCAIFRYKSLIARTGVRGLRGSQGPKLWIWSLVYKPRARHNRI